MILAVDCGNTRLKWGLYQDGDWRRTAVVAITDLAKLEKHWKRVGPAGRVVVANVAGTVVRRKLGSIFSRLSLHVTWVEPKRQQCGVTNGYRSPRQLGADRWAALIGAQSLGGGPCLVVMAGTATTADILEDDGRFAGGVILPGVDLMKRSLVKHTAGLAHAKGRFAAHPGRTADAIETGCLLAQAGAIERMLASMPPGAECLIAGGAAARIVPHLRIRPRQVDNLVLEGLLRIAIEPTERKGVPA